MAAKDTMFTFAYEQGWTESTQLEMMFQFVDEMGEDGLQKLNEFLQERQDKSAHYHVTDIDWDLSDDENKDNSAMLELPDETVMCGNPDDFADQLSDHYGFCVLSLDHSVIEANISEDDLEHLKTLPHFDEFGKFTGHYSEICD